MCACVCNSKLRFVGCTRHLLYEAPPSEYFTESLLKIVLNPLIVCVTHGLWLVSHQAQHLCNSLKHPNDVCEDFFGKYIHSGSHPFTFDG